MMLMPLLPVPAKWVGTYTSWKPEFALFPKRVDGRLIWLRRYFVRFQMGLWFGYGTEERTLMPEVVGNVLPFRRKTGSGDQ